MELELHQLELSYERLRKRSPAREKRLLASLAHAGQLSPVVVVASAVAGRHVLLDGYKRVRALARLHRDTVLATTWELPEADALVLERLMRSTDTDGPLEQGWLLLELRDRFGLAADELARRFDKSPSWVSRRLALVAALPAPIQEQVRKGELVAHAAMKFLVPLARANDEDAILLAAAIGPIRPTCRQVGAIYKAWLSGDTAARERLLADPGLFLRAAAVPRASPEKSPAELLLDDLGALGGIARRLRRRLREGLAARLSPPERAECQRCFLQARSDLQPLFTVCEKELSDARPADPLRDPAAR